MMYKPFPQNPFDETFVAVWPNQMMWVPHRLGGEFIHPIRSDSLEHIDKYAFCGLPEPFRDFDREEEGQSIFGVIFGIIDGSADLVCEYALEYWCD